mmetsp:Transcript_5403/g.21322  ORF Transcript_5403/g.21322 Transcript_5403/m.21322 type:complete len:217 (-) Transcript_5403:129-779(-)
MLDAILGMGPLAKPMMSTWAPHASVRMPSACCTPPTVSKSTSTPLFAGSAARTAERSPFPSGPSEELSMTTSAPSRLSRDTLRWPRPTATTNAPWRLESCTAACPTPPPAPSTSTVCPARSAARSRSATCAVPNAIGRPAAASTSSAREPLADGRASSVGSRSVWSAEHTTSSANAPAATDTTASPTLRPLTPAPTSVTVPLSSPPGTNGYAGRSW